MEIIEAIHTRRSIRKYTSEKISGEHLKIILECAMSAPSAGNSQPWHFIVIDDRKIFERICEFHHSAKMTLSASHAILVCGDTKLEKYKGRIPLDCSAASQNILLSALALGIGSVWVGIYPEETRINGIRNIFSLPDNIIPISLISLGYPDEIRSMQERYNQDRVHYNSF